MMEIGAILKSSAAVVASIGVIGGGAYTLDQRHAPRAQVQKMEAGQHVQTIQEWIKVSRIEGPQPYICDAIIWELNELCTEAPSHYFCQSDVRRETLDRAGC